MLEKLIQAGNKIRMKSRTAALATALAVIGAASSAYAAGTQYVCKGWAMTGNDPTSGTTNNFTMTATNSATLNWLWNTNYMLATSVSPTNGGTVNIASNGWEPSSSIINGIVSTPNVSSGYHCTGFSGATNGCTVTASTLDNLAMTGPKGITALFDLNQYPFTSTSSGNGSLNFTGTTNVTHGNYITFVANATQPGNRVEQILLDGVSVYSNTLDNSLVTTNWTYGPVTNVGHAVDFKFMGKTLNFQENNANAHGLSTPSTIRYGDTKTPAVPATIVE